MMGRDTEKKAERKKSPGVWNEGTKSFSHIPARDKGEMEFEQLKNIMFVSTELLLLFFTLSWTKMKLLVDSVLINTVTNTSKNY